MKFIEIPDSVKSISYWAFESCQGITSVKVKATTPPAAYNNCFSDCPYLTEIQVPFASVNAYKAASGWSEYADIIKKF